MTVTVFEKKQTVKIYVFGPCAHGHQFAPTLPPPPLKNYSGPNEWMTFVFMQLLTQLRWSHICSKCLLLLQWVQYCKGNTAFCASPHPRVWMGSGRWLREQPVKMMQITCHKQSSYPGGSSAGHKFAFTNEPHSTLVCNAPSWLAGIQLTFKFHDFPAPFLWPFFYCYCELNPFTSKVPKPKNKQHHNKVLLNSFPMKSNT